MIDSSSYEDQLNILLESLSKIISTFGTLSREQAEIAILDTASKIKEGESIIEKLEQELEKNEKNRSKEELQEEKQKIKNYKTEFNNIDNKIKIIQNNYINKKEKNALIDEEPKSKVSDLLSNEERKNDLETKDNEVHNNNNIDISNKKNDVFVNNIGNLSGVNKVPTLNDDPFINFKRTRSKYKRNCAIFWIVFAVVIVVVLLLVMELRK